MWSSSYALQPPPLCNQCSCIVETARTVPGQWWQYRIAFEDWTKAQATDEMINGGFGFHPIWQNLLRYIEELDVNAIKEQVAKQGAWQ